MLKKKSNNKIKGLLNEEMPREKLVRIGSENLTDVELLSILLRTGTKRKNVIELSREILSKYSLENISTFSYYDLVRFEGINFSKATTLIASFEIVKRIKSKKKNKRETIKSPEDLFNLVKEDFYNLDQEILLAIFVDNKNYVLKKEILNKGTISSTIVDKRTIIKKCFDYKATGLFLVHNHFGDTQPSEQDIITTKDLKKTLKSIDIRFLDHLIISNGEYRSIIDE